jgi:hypothetical protein
VPEALAASKNLKMFFRLRILSSKNGFASQVVYRKCQRKKRKKFTV